MNSVKSEPTHTRCGYLWRRCRSVKMVIMVMTLCVTGILFVSFDTSSLWKFGYIPLAWQTGETEASNSTDRNVHIQTSHILFSPSKEPQNHLDTLPTNIIQLGQENGTVKYEVKDGCTFTDSDTFHSSIMTLHKISKPVTCEGGVTHLVYRSDYSIKVNHSRTALVGDSNNRFKECRYKTLAKKPGSDFETVVLYTSHPFNDSITLRESDDNLVVECYGNKNTVLSRSYFSLIRVKPDLEVLLEERFKKHMTLNAPKEVFNVLMIGIDGTSKQNFQRHMPKTRNFLLNVLNATELHKYNKVGENTFPNLVTLLTGKPSSDLLTYNWTNKIHLDRVNDKFLWSDFNKAGYRTGAFFDRTYITAFHYLKRGWNKPPVDYYHRAIILESERDKLMKGQSRHCVGDIPEITLNHDFWVQMASTFNNSQTKPFFGFSFSSRLTHNDNNLASAGDDLYLRFLEKLRDKNITNNTVIVFFSDHGARFGQIRQTYNGMIEANTPYIFLILPSWFHQKYPDLMKVLKINQERLTTHTDVYETVRDLLNFQAETRLGDINKTGISLFQEIPRERTCEHAGITEDFCVCNNFIETNVSSEISKGLTMAVQDRLRQLVFKVREKCAAFTFDSFHSILSAKPGKIGKKKAVEATTLYRVILTVNPGGAMYEATITFTNSTKTFQVIGHVTRINLYKDQANCISDPSLRPFCFCKK